MKAFDPPQFPGYRGVVYDGYYRNLPHWRLEGATYFVTWRLDASQVELSPNERSVVLDAVLHFHEDRYVIYGAVVMNDHVHVICKPTPPVELHSVLHSWKSFTANRLQSQFRRAGRIWQHESFDRVVRDEREFMEKLNYVFKNPFKRWPDLKEYTWTWIHPQFAG